MRNIILIFLSIVNLIIIEITLSFNTGIDYLSLRIIFVAFSLVTSVYMILLYRTSKQLIIALIAVFISLIHILLIIRIVFQAIYS
ncbi:hypothetical protein RN70_03185 [Staphylococcus schleiferi]|uniref:Uncharacterized protein n=1 Tax=Staphylococcus coagulans TaxID=74706 RepID=A0A9X1DUG6_9STAP|nr:MULTISPECIES: hypothetical protein [Staphylococcus]AKS66484.1 hypothetical protein LH95_02910 [Staphylococcus schleiferi]AKS68601.1 hypothetical protein NP71_02990 [Staphylococcus schleiferi]AKS70825.1 hypothetical protein OA96_02875 [Staphylococcus schleiferi]AKS72996.1 hypothetical protein RN70_03185 [Staphylococcus schleiferi]MBA8760314.1 hypothetical protein [Staphylococcus coagulans]